MGGRDKGTLSKLMERLSRWKVELFCTDNWGVYPEVIVKHKLYQSKSQTVYLEQNNGRQRHWFARFRRKSIVVSKTLEMVDLTMVTFLPDSMSMEAGKILRHYLVDTLLQHAGRENPRMSGENIPAQETISP